MPGQQGQPAHCPKPERGFMAPSDARAGRPKERNCQRFRENKKQKSRRSPEKPMALKDGEFRSALPGRRLAMRVARDEQKSEEDH